LLPRNVWNNGFAPILLSQPRQLVAAHAKEKERRG